MTSSEASSPEPLPPESGHRFHDLINAVEEAASATELLQATRALAVALEHPGLGATGEAPPLTALACLVRILGFNNPGAAVAAVDGLIASGSAAVSPLLEGLDAQNYGARAWAVRALAGIGDVRGLDLLEQALAEDIGPSVRRAAAIGMGTLKVDHLPPTDRAAVQGRALKALQGARHDGEWVVRYAVATAMEKLAFGLQGEEDPGEVLAALDHLADIVHEEVPVVRLRARLALTRLCPP